ncbi:LysR family transcriptional regulator [Marinobacter subterrani]|uniref:DNA-binding transcriptional regulator, LysR family n=1 Tax=Marinobacter subterrani TaxID=1658765 RepID=A0A0J7M3P6_9GAMM|nr:LysR family transcriptional regulator [Marinobacter subterrani]KMQ75590.1 DNA-binding transcriptional regulator, LysR family [Marinobacter subterrani]
MLNLVWLKSFLSLVRHQSFQVAAEHLGIAQPTLSQHIQKLEQQLEVMLIRRGKARCEPTRAALALVPFANSMLRLDRQARAAVHGSGLRVGASSNIGIYMLQPSIRALRDSPSAPAVDLVIDTNPAIARQLSNGELDVAVMEWWLPQPGFRSMEWRREPVVLIVPPEHPCADLPEIDRETLAGMTLLGGEPGTGTGRLLAEFFGNEGPFPTVSMQLGSTEAVKQAIKAGLGISLVLAACVREEVRSGSLRAIPVSDPGLAKELMVVCPDAFLDHPPVATFVSHLCH